MGLIGNEYLVKIGGNKQSRKSVSTNWDYMNLIEPLTSQEYFYTAVPPQADNDLLAEKGTRLIFQHSHQGLKIVVAPINIITAGWVIGVDVKKAGGLAP